MSKSKDIFTEGFAPFFVDDSEYQTYYKVSGSLKNSPNPPLVALHGGAGLAHNYLVYLADLTVKFDIPVVLYDQFGGGKSTHLPHKGCDFWTTDLMCDQLEQLLDYLEISDKFHLYGHSWGGVLGPYFAGSRKPRGLQRIVIQSGGVSFPSVYEGVSALVSELPEEIQEAIRKYNNHEEYDEDAIKKGDDIFFTKHVCSVKPVPQPLQDTYAEIGKDSTVNLCMMGKGKYKHIGTTKDLSCIEFLPDITAAALIINSRYDMAQDVTMEPFYTLMPNRRWLHFLYATHVPFFEDREFSMDIIGKFLTEPFA